MGLAEQIQAGASLTRKSTTFTTNTSGSGSVSIDASYAILSIQSSTPCRIRFYDNEASRDNVGETTRPFLNTNISSSVALIGDFSMSAAGVYTIDPILYAVSENASTPLTYYRVEPTTPSANITITTYTIEDKNVPVGLNQSYTVNNRRNLLTVSANLAAGEMASGSILNDEIPSTYLLVYASGSDATNTARLRLYSTSGSLENDAEKNRPFATEPSASANLIADMILLGTNVTYFSPKIVGSNLQNVGQDLLLLRGNQSLLDGKTEVYYILQNAGASPAVVGASVSVFALEG